MNEKKAHILEVAKDLITRYGVRAVTMDELALESGVSKKTLYMYFKDKKELVREVVMDRINRMKTQIEKILNNEQYNSLDKSIEIYKLIIELYRKHPPVVEHDLRKFYADIFSEIQDFVRRQMFNAIVDNLEAGKKCGLIREDLDSRVIAALQIGRYKALRENLDLLQGYDIEHIMQQLLIYHLHGICTPKGLEYIKTNKKLVL